ncbi:MAG TPA: TonB family protein [Thermoanaerobaculia bacterium]|nr:TonB family protein [Thermoanaerobaculia bacterium]
MKLKRFPFSISRFPLPVALALVWTAAFSAPQLAQNRGAELLQQQKPGFPASMDKAMRQGNVNLIARVDTNGTLQDIKAVGSSHPDFVGPAVAAARLWQFRPAIHNGKPVEIAANIGMRFRFDSPQRGQLFSPMVGDLPVFPADASGNRAAPEGFPIRLGADPKLRVEAVLDVSPGPARALKVRVDAVSPRGRRVALFDRSVDMRAGATDVSFPFSAPVGADWDEGIWLIHVIADGADVGGGQVWVARDPWTYDFAKALQKLTP